jgi:hypothetical protein
MYISLRVGVDLIIDKLLEGGMALGEEINREHPNSKIKYLGI